MGARIPLTAAVLAIGLGLAGCSAGERPPLWTLYDDPTAQAPPVDGNAIVYDRRIEAYTWPDVSMRLGGFTGLYDPYLYPGRYGWYGGPPGWGRPPYIGRNPATQRSFGIRPAVPGPQTLPPAPAAPTLAPRPAAPLVAPPVAPPVVTAPVAPPAAAAPPSASSIPAPPPMRGR